MRKEEFLKEVRYDSKNTLAIDFDGVVHKNSKGFFDGTIYDDPIPGTKDALEFLSKRFSRIIIFTCKAMKKRPLINGKTGKELILEWLEIHDLSQYIYDITSEKPVAAAYIDDNGFKFNNWNDTIEYIKKYFMGLPYEESGLYYLTRE